MLATVARRNYEKDYKDEIELNEKFHLFVTNYQRAHQGPNTLKGQVDARVKNASKMSKQVYTVSVECTYVCPYFYRLQ